MFNDKRVDNPDDFASYDDEKSDCYSMCLDASDIQDKTTQDHCRQKCNVLIAREDI